MVVFLQTLRDGSVRMVWTCLLYTSVNTQGDRTFLQDPGTSAEFCFEDCDLSLLDHIDLLQIAGTFHLPKFDGEGAAKLLRAAKERGVITSMDVTSDRSGRWTGILDPCYAYLDYFLPSIEQEMCIRDSSECADMNLRSVCFLGALGDTDPEIVQWLSDTLNEAVASQSYADLTAPMMMTPKVWDMDGMSQYCKEAYEYYVSILK